MLNCYDLNGVWKARGFDGQHGDPNAYLSTECQERGFIDAIVPGEIHLDLERQKLIPDCRYGTNAQSARWVEEQIWLFRKEFISPDIPAGSRAHLVFDGLDLVAEIYLNGELIGEHADFFLPCRIDITDKLLKGSNLLAVKLDSGLYWASEKPASSYNFAMDVKLHKRHWLRKPQCQFSWDWNPRLVNIGIWKDVHIDIIDNARLDTVSIYPELSDDHKSAVVNIHSFIENTCSESVHAQIVARITETKAEITKDIELQPGKNTYSLQLGIDNPELWYPRPSTQQPLYTVEVELRIDGKKVDSRIRRTGIRSVSICRNPHPKEGHYFTLMVNGTPVFAKGGNWVPPDIIYARITSDDYRNLVQIAVDANFNMLRIWGGGLYADNALLDACDEMGVMVWHDFIFACSEYPVDDNEFFNRVKEEITYNVRDLSPHPSLVVWCGNNEIEWGDWEWGYDNLKPHPHYYLFHNSIPRILKQEDPSKPYWPSSPYSEDSVYPNSPVTGDQHPWHVSLGADGVNFHAYRDDVSRFPNEGGILGASTPATIRQVTPVDQLHLFSPTWEFHDNACNYGGAKSICYDSLLLWMGKKPEDFSFEDYLFYSSVLQSEGLQEYINNYRRRMYDTSSAIFWMYNDSWPQSHGWTIIDYYLRKKLSYHPVRRAFAPVNVVPAFDGDIVNIYGINETQSDWKGTVRFGVFRFEGGLPINRSNECILPANKSIVIGSVTLDEWNALCSVNTGVFCVLIDENGEVAQNRILNNKFNEYNWKKPNISVRRDGQYAVFSSDAFVWAACIEIDGQEDVPDNCFDILPGIEYRISWPQEKRLPEIVKYASMLYL